MKYNEAFAVGKMLVASRHPLLVMGSPGIGKTTLMRNIADDLGYDFVILKPVQMSRTDFGEAYLGEESEDGSVRIFPLLSEMVEPIKNPKRETLVLFDDVGQAPELVQGPLLSITHPTDPRLHGAPIDPRVRVAVATNTNENRGAEAKAFLSSLYSRFVGIVTLEADAVSWLEWARSTHLHPGVCEFIAANPQLLDQPPELGSFGFPCPRNWEWVGRSLGRTMWAIKESFGSHDAGSTTAASLREEAGMLVAIYKTMIGVKAAVALADHLYLPVQQRIITAAHKLVSECLAENVNTRAIKNLWYAEEDDIARWTVVECAARVVGSHGEEARKMVTSFTEALGAEDGEAVAVLRACLNMDPDWIQPSEKKRSVGAEVTRGRQ